jgi:hypothetical protein
VVAKDQPKVPVVERRVRADDAGSGTKLSLNRIYPKPQLQQSEVLHLLSTFSSSPPSPGTMDLKSIGAKNSSSQSLSSRRSSIDSNSSRPSRSRLSKLLPIKGRRRSTAQTEAARRRLVENAKVPEVPELRLNLVDSDTEDVITVDDTEG